MTHPIIGSDIYIETAFERRFHAILRSSLQNRTWHVLVADPGSGKTTGLVELVRTSGFPSGTLSGKSYPILAITAPKNDESEQALGNQIFAALGMKPPGRYWSERKPLLMGYLVKFGTRLLIVDDAHDLSLQHLMFLKGLTDQGRLQFNYRLGLCLVTAARGNVMPLKEILDQPETMWQQFRHRLDKLQPFCRILGHTSLEVQEILATLETTYRGPFPHLNLRQWSDSIYDWLTQPVLDPGHSGRVTMDHLMKLVTTVLEWSYQAGETDVKAQTLLDAAELLILRRDTIRLIDGAGPSLDAPPEDATKQGNGKGPEQEVVQAKGQQNTTEMGGTVGEQAQTVKTPKCTFAKVISIDLKRFADSSVSLVECPDCARTRSLTPHKGVLRFPSHDQRKIQTPNTLPRWVRGQTDWDVVGGEGPTAPSAG